MQRFARGLALVQLAACGGGGGPAGIDAPPGPVADAPPPGEAVFPLAVSADHHHLVDQRGRPFLIVGDTAWSLIAQLPEADAATYLDDRRARGVNTILVSLIEHAFTSHDPPWASAAGVVPFTTTGDFATFDDAYLAHADRVIELAAERGILVMLVPAYLGYGCGGEGWCGEMAASGTAALTAYGEHLGAHYRDTPNLVWVEGGDHLPSSDQLALVDAVGAGIAAGDGGAHLHTAHWSRGHDSAEVPELGFPLGLDASYTGDSVAAHVELLDDAAGQRGVRPAFVIENIYENESSGQLRFQLYQPVLAGESGTFFGNDPMWFFGEAGDQNPGWSFGDGAFASWREALDSPGVHDLARSRAVFESVAWWTLAPDTAHAVMTEGFGALGDPDYVLCAASPNRDLAMAYLPGAALTPTVDLGAFPAPVTARWLDPTTASEHGEPGSPFANAGRHTFTPPGTNAAGDADWVLVLTAP